NTGEINNKSGNIERTVTHETLHFLGLSDRYDKFDNNLSTNKKVHSGFSNDIMGTGNDFNNVHYENILDYAKGLPNNSNENGFDYYGNQTIMYDRPNKVELKNGTKPRTNYDPRS